MYEIFDADAEQRHLLAASVVSNASKRVRARNTL